MGILFRNWCIMRLDVWDELMASKTDDVRLLILLAGGLSTVELGPFAISKVLRPDRYSPILAIVAGVVLVESASSPLETTAVARTAVIQAKRGIGDVVWHLPFVRAIASVSPGGQVTFMAPPSSRAKDLMLAQSSGAVSTWSDWRGCCGGAVFEPCGFLTGRSGPLSPPCWHEFRSALVSAWDDSRFSSLIPVSVRAISMTTRSIGYVLLWPK
jgi:hypothetical protein